MENRTENAKENNLRVGAGAVIVKDGMTLLTKRKGSHGEGAWGSMGGHVEFGESPMETVKREAREELGIEIGNLKFVTCLSMIRDGKHYIDISFTAELISGEPKIQEPDKIESIAWFPLDNLPGPLFDPVRVALESIKTGESYFELNM